MNATDEKIKNELSEKGISLSIRNRKLAGGYKKYFVVSTKTPSYSGQPYYRVAKEIISKYYPECGITSCGMSSATIAEY